ncbi:MAG: YggS family pyridoxal phosphate-dependent enzyme [Bacteroidales bacterium]
MNDIEHNLNAIRREIGDQVMAVAVSKNHPAEEILEAYQAGQRIFGENRVQEILAKQPFLPADIEWHMIGHLQTNKVKLLVPFISMIQSVDSLKLLTEVSIQAQKNQRVIDCLLQIFIASEETKFGLDEKEVKNLLTAITQNPLPGIRIRGLMGMATFTDDKDQIRREFRGLKSLFDKIRDEFFRDDNSFNELSIGMSGDYLIAIEEGSTIVRIGTKIFGSR